MSLHWVYGSKLPLLTNAPLAVHTIMNSQENVPLPAGLCTRPGPEVLVVAVDLPTPTLWKWNVIRVTLH